MITKQIFFQSDYESGSAGRAEVYFKETATANINRYEVGVKMYNSYLGVVAPVYCYKTLNKYAAQEQFEAKLDTLSAAGYSCVFKTKGWA